ncbi:MAG: uroporphyrinogen-III synthase [Elusimicrobia bacterium]|nr:uroporphyrinogen-III synthase [Elusimicrobiota bacterium]
MIVLTRPKNQAADFAKRLRSLGGKVTLLPTIQILPLYSPRLKQAIRKLQKGSYDWLIFTSANAAGIFSQCLKKNLPPSRRYPLPRSMKTCAIGPKTAEAMKKCGLPVHRIAEEYRAEAIPPLLGNLCRKRILLPRAKIARDYLPKTLRRLKARVDVVSLYHTKLPPAPSHLTKHTMDRADVITFTSSSTARNFASLFSKKERKKIFQKTRAASIGPITTATLKKLKIPVSIEAKKYTAEGLTEAMIRHFKTSPRSCPILNKS